MRWRWLVVGQRAVDNACVEAPQDLLVAYDTPGAAARAACREAGPQARLAGPLARLARARHRAVGAVGARNRHAGGWRGGEPFVRRRQRHGVILAQPLGEVR